MRIYASVFAAFTCCAALSAPAEDSAASLAVSASQALANGHLDAASDDLAKAMKRFPRSPDLDVVYWLNCRIKLSRNAAADALVFCSTAIFRNPKNSNFYADRAEAYFRTGDIANAWRDIDAAKAAGNTRASLEGLEARLLWEGGATTSAQAVAKAARSRDPQDANAAFVLAALREKRVPDAAPSAVPRLRPAAQKPEVSAPSSPFPPPEARLRCSRPVNWAVREVCRTATLKAADAHLQRRFAWALTVAADVPALETSQRDWIARRNTCQNRECLVIAYSERTAFLSLWAAE